MIPNTTKALVVRKSPPGRSPPFHDAVVEEMPIATPRKGQVLVKMGAVSFNHRDLWIRKGQYPGIAFGSVFGADGAGTVISAGIDAEPLLNKRVFLVPMRGWENNPDAPESRFGILGGGNHPPLGTFAEYVTVDRDQVIPAPEHLDDVHVAAWPLGGVTAWRAVSINAQIKHGDNVLITGIGGGVALIAMQICLAKGANVYVSSGNDEKIRKAVSLGAKSGVNYKSKNWSADLGRILKKDRCGLDAVIDSGGGDVMEQTSKYLNAGGKVVSYGMTANPKITFTMREVLKNHKLIGSTMGSHKDLVDATQFVNKHRIVPVVADVLEGLHNADRGFEMMGRGDQFGKIVIKISHEEQKSKL
ncbi:NAD(P)-binding protein [Rickenella mellea]|uniref:NAD(P)-binding protein n=1 Tax=Rickenella mellea TaxID=50990 RepID=A0A4Y7QI57_9AGAM|nr:NAD(P)-binding protein [Rickenella mellea]